MEDRASNSPTVSLSDASVSPPIETGSQQPTSTRDGLVSAPIGHVADRPAAAEALSMSQQSAKPSAKSSSPATVADFLAALNLSEYYQNFIDEGFDRMSSVLEVTEEDLTAMGVKRGHRRTIQRQIASIKGLPFTATLEIPRRKGEPGAESETTSPVSPEERGRGGRVVQTNSNVIIFKGKQIAVTGDDMEERSKRRYRRHPKPDLNAPDKPPSAYVTFSNGIREELKGTKSFSELARIVGERWKTLDPVRKERLETSAARAKEQYHSALAAYKTTPQYAAYQQYLAEFKARHAPQDNGSRDRKATLKPPTPPVAGALSSSIPHKRPSSANTEPYMQDDYSDTDSDGSVEMPSNEAFFAKQMEDARLKRRRESNGLTSVSPVPSMMMAPGSGGPPIFTRPFGIDGLTPPTTLPGPAPAVSTTRSTLDPVEAPTWQPS